MIDDHDNNDDDDDDDDRDEFISTHYFPQIQEMLSPNYC